MTRKTKHVPARDEDLIRAFLAKAPHVVSTLIFPGASAYYVSGASEVLSTANGHLRSAWGIDFDAYVLEVVAPTAGPVSLDMGLKMLPDRSVKDPVRAIGTLLLSAGSSAGIDGCLQDKDVMGWIRRAAAKAERVASMCTGAFLLAEAGLVQHAVTTHWGACDRMRQRFPHLVVNGDSIFVKEGNIYSSAGSTASMDLALALVEEDLGRKLAMNVARDLVMFLKRPGGQSQFSTALLAQATNTDALKGLPEWIADNLDEDLSVEALAARVGMSPRNFTRIFAAETKLTPAKYVERARLERARQLMEETKLPLQSVATKAGFDSHQNFRRTFVRWLGVTPAEYLNRFCGSGPIPTAAVIAKNSHLGPQPWLP
ncbi:MAG: helix-turn-helix domain-containing protein [Rhodospirillaceae bacterium]|nr:helix-turn-helix domain-containing protein [Rhodospirillaceae bacterium]